MITNEGLARLVEQLAKESGENASRISEVAGTVDLVGQAVAAIICELRNSGAMSRQSWTEPSPWEARPACLLCGAEH